MCLYICAYNSNYSVIVLYLVMMSEVFPYFTYVMGGGKCVNSQWNMELTKFSTNLLLSDFIFMGLCKKSVGENSKPVFTAV